MAFINRFAGTRAEDDDPSLPVTHKQEGKTFSFQILFRDKADLTTEKLTATLRSYHPSLSRGHFEIDPEFQAKGTPLGLAGWGNHVVKLVGFDLPMPAEVVERCVQPAHYGQDLKQQARDHKAHVLLYYEGREALPRECYIALAVVAGVLADHGAVAVCNEDAHTSFPAGPLRASSEKEDMLEQLRTLPLLILYCGFVKMFGDQRGIWMRTYGNQLFGLPDLAHLAKDHDQGQHIFDLFNNILEYLLKSGAKFGVGHTMQVGDDTFMKLRAPTEAEPFLDSEGEMFVAEFITKDQINKPR